MLPEINLVMLVDRENIIATITSTQKTAMRLKVFVSYIIIMQI